MSDVSVSALAERFMLPEDFLKGLDVIDHQGHVNIDYGQGARRRQRLTLNGEDGKRFSWTSGRNPITVYGARLDGKLDLAREAGWLYLVEGESDCWALWHAGLPALGIPGAKMVNRLEREHLEGIETAFIVREPDSAGSGFVEGVQKRIGELYPNGDAPNLSVVVMGELGHAGDKKSSEVIKDPAELWVETEARVDDFTSHLHRQKGIARRVEPIAPQPSRGNFRLIVGREILDMPAPEWLVEGVLVKGTLNMLYGPSWIGKSVLGLDLAAHLATGRTWAGHDVSKGRVLYIIAEGVGDIGQRVRAWESHYGTHPEALDYIVEPVYLDVDDNTDVEILVEQVKSLSHDYDLVIVDTLARSMLGDENSTAHMGAVIRACDQIRLELGAAVLLVHHTGKDLKLPRGAYALYGAVDTSMKLSRFKSHDRMRRLVCDKLKYAAPFEPIGFELAEEEPSVVMRESRLAYWGSANGENANENRDKRRLILTFLSDSGLSGPDWAAVGVDAGVAQATFYRTKNRLLKDGFVEEKNDLFHITDKGRDHFGFSQEDE